MSNFKSVRIVLAASALILSTAAAAEAAGPEFCEAYAHAAENQVRGGFSHASCAGGMRGARWATEYRVHYEWCRQVSPGEAEAERDARTAYLRACR